MEAADEALLEQVRLLTGTLRSVAAAVAALRDAVAGLRHEADAWGRSPVPADPGLLPG